MAVWSQSSTVVRLWGARLRRVAARAAGPAFALDSPGPLTQEALLTRELLPQSPEGAPGV